MSHTRSRQSLDSVAPVECCESRSYLAAQLTFELSAADVSEAALPGTVTGTITRLEAPDLATPVVVTLSNSDAAAATLPATVTIPANETSVTFPIHTVNDGLVDGAQVATLGAQAAGFASAATTLTVSNDDSAGVRTLGGRLSGTIAAGNYRVLQDILVPAGHTLTIAPNTTLRFHAGREFRVQGQLLAQGSAAQPILFRSAAPTQTPGAWAGIRLDNPGQAESLLEQIEVRDAVIGVDISPLDEGTVRARIAFGNIHDNSSHGVRISTEDGQFTNDVVVSDSRLHDNAGHGVHLQASTAGVTNTTIDASLLRNEIDHNGQSGVELDALSDSLTGIKRTARIAANIVENRIHHNASGIQGVSSRDDSSEHGTSLIATVVNNVIADNVGHGTTWAAGSLAGLSPTIVNNTIVRNGDAAIDIDDDSVGYLVLNNILADNAVGIRSPSGATATPQDVGFNNVHGNTTANFVGFGPLFGGLTGQNRNGTPADAAMNISVPSLLAAGDHLAPGSAAVDAGLPYLDEDGDVHSQVPQTDIDGAPRLGAPDLGADEARYIQLVLPPQAPEGVGSLVGQVVRSDHDLSQPLTVLVTVTPAGYLQGPATIQFAAGQSTAEVTFLVDDDGRIEPDRKVNFRLTADGFRAAKSHIVLTDDELAPLIPESDPIHLQSILPQDAVTSSPSIVPVLDAYVAAWTRRPNGGPGNQQVVARFLDRSGVPASAEIIVDEVEKSVGSFAATIEADASGGFLVVWQFSAAEQPLRELRSRRFNAGGVPTGDVVVLQTTTQNVTFGARLARLPDGFAMTYQDGVGGLFWQKLDAQGTPNGAPVALNAGLEGSAEPAARIASNARGDQIVAWRRTAQDADAVFVTRFDSATDQWSAPAQLTSQAFQLIGDVAVAINASAEFVVSWSGPHLLSGLPEFPTDGPSDVWLRSFNSSGVPKSPVVRVTPTAFEGPFVARGASSFDAFVAYDPRGRIIAAWTGTATGEGTSAPDSTFFKTFTPEGVDLGPAHSLPLPTHNNESGPQVAIGTDGSLLFGWTSAGSPLSGNGVYARRFKTEEPLLEVTFATTAVVEGKPAVVGTVTRSGVNLAGELTVHLASSDATELAVPATVTIPAGQASATFHAAPVNDALDDGPQHVLVTPTANQFASTPGALVVHDNDLFLTNLPATQTYTENAAPRVLAPSALVANVGTPDFDGGTLTVTISSGKSAADRLDVRNIGTAAGQIGFDGADVTFGGAVIGARTASDPLVITFNAAATRAAVQALVRAVTFRVDGDNPLTRVRQVRFQLTDGDGGVSASINQTLNITAVNDKPVLAGIPSPQAYKENGAAKLLAPQATVADPDSADFASGKLTVKSTAGGLGSDRLTIRHQGSGPGQVGVSGDTLSVGGVVVGTFTGGTGLQPLVITFNADAKLLRVQAVLRNISYQNISDNPTNFGATPSRTVNYLLTDGDGGTSVAVNQTLNITAVNDAVVVGNFTDASTYTAGAGATILDANATVTDADSANFAGGNLVLMFSAGGVATNRLAIRNQGTGANQIGVSGSNVTFGGTVIGTLNANAGIGLNALIVTFTDAATPGRVQALIRNLTYHSTTADPTGPKTLTLKVRDGDGGLTTVNKPLNIAPALAGPARSSAAFASYADWEGAL